MNTDMSDRDQKTALDLQIVENLRRAYNKTMDEAVPDRLLDLLRKLREQEATAATERNGDE